MKHLARLRRMLLILACGIALSASAQEAALNPASSAFPGDDALLDLIRAQVDAGRAVGIVLGVMDADGSSRIVSYGDAGPGAAPLGPDSLFEIGSISKVFTASVLAYMNATQLVDLDDPVQEHSPPGLLIPVFDGQAITLANLAEQNSGLPALPTNFFSTEKAGNAFGGYSVADLADFLATYELPRAPGASFEYSNLGVGLLGMVLANKAGLSYEELVRKYILNPLEMHSTGIGLNPAMAAAKVAGHDLRAQPLQDTNTYPTPPFQGAGALKSSMRDLLKFLAANLRTPETELERALHFAQLPRADAGSGKIGLNWFSTTTSGGVDVVYHSGSTVGFSSFMGFDAARKVGVIMLANQIGVSSNLAFHLLDPTIPISKAPPTAEELGAIKLSAGQLASFEGVFVLNTPPNMRLTISAEDEMLYVETAGVGRVPFFPDSPTTAFTTFVDARITLVADEQGNIAGLVLTMDGRNQEATKAE